MKPWDEAEARELLAKGTPYNQIAKIYGSSWSAVRCWLDPEFAAKRRVQRNTAKRISRSRAGKAASINNYRSPPSSDISLRLAEIPPDTRSMTQRLMGDPLPQRSALAKRGTV